MRVANVSLGFIALVLGFYLLYLGKGIVLPLVIALVLWYIAILLTDGFSGLRLGKLSLPRPLAFAAAIATSIGVIWLVVNLVNSNIEDVVAAAPAYQARLEVLAQRAYAAFGISEPLTISQVLETVNLRTIISGLATTVTVVAGYTGMILVYLILLFMEYKSFGRKLEVFLGNSERTREMRDLLKRIRVDVNTYIRIKTGVSLLTAVLAYAVLALVGLDFAAFWALLIFLLNFIPTIGSIIAVLFPMLLALIQFDTLGPFIILSVSLIAIQFAIGSVLEPRLTGHSLNLSPLVILLSLALWGQIWGVAGMFLCVPIMVIANIALAHFPSTRRIAIMLSSDGRPHG